MHFLVADAFSGQFLRSIPFDPVLLFTNAAWAVAVATYAGVPIPQEWGVAIVKGRAECLLALLECTVPNASPRSKVACGKSRDKLIERANVAHCSGGFAEAVLLRRRYAVMKEAARARRR